MNVRNEDKTNKKNGSLFPNKLVLFKKNLFLTREKKNSFTPYSNVMQKFEIQIK